MKLGDPIIIGYPAVGGPIILGSLKNHGFCGEFLIGTTVEVNNRLFTFNVSYAQHNPKREQLVPILVPKEKLDAEFWTDNITKAEEKPAHPPAKQEEFPF